MKILYVCTGNTCRSPMAEGMTLKKLENHPTLRDKVSAGSAGLSASGKSEASMHALEVLRSRGIDFARHRSRSVTRALIEDATFVLAMARSHCRDLTHRFPDQAQKIHLLREFAGEEGRPDIDDPFEGDLNEYLACGEVIERAIEGVLMRLTHRAFSTVQETGDRSQDGV